MSLNSVFTEMEMDQNSRRDLKVYIGAQTDQNSQGDLIKKTSPNFTTIRKAIEELDIAGIEHFTGIPDYTEATRSPNPIVVKSPTSCQCIDGWELIEAARSQDKLRIACFVFYIHKYSETEMAIRKTAIRVMPQGGRCIYAELIRNARHLYNMMVASIENPIIFSHGGARKGASYTENKSDNIRSILSDRIGKSVTTINKYLSFGEYVDDETMGVLIESKAEKAFFEQAASNKRLTIKDLRGNDEPADTITKNVSAKTLSWLQEFRENKKKIKPILYDEYQSEENDGADTAPANESCKIGFPQKFDHWAPVEDSENASLPTEEDIRNELKKIGVAQVVLANNKSKTLQEFTDEVRQQVSKMTVLFQSIMYFSKQKYMFM